MKVSTQEKNPLVAYFDVAVKAQSYLNLFYLLLSFPLGIFYFVFLVTGLALGISLTIIWVGIPILVLVAAAWWGLAFLERQMVVHWLKMDIPPMTLPPSEDKTLITRLREFVSNPTTWTSLLYLVIKFPLGILSFIILVTVISISLSFLAMPVLYQVFEITDAAFNLGASWVWQIDSLADAFFFTFIGAAIFPAALYICNAVTWLHSQLAKMLLGTSKPAPIQPA